MSKIKANGHEVPRDALLAALHNNSRAVGMGVMHDIGRDLTRKEAQKALEGRESFCFDYFLGRPLKVFERNGEIDGRLYDRDNGDGAFARAVEDALTMPEEP